MDPRLLPRLPSNHRLVALADSIVTFRCRDSAHKNKKRLMTLEVNEFRRQLFLHVLPPGFVHIRRFGFPAHRRRGSLHRRVGLARNAAGR
jgi:hypothetical protein